MESVEILKEILTVLEKILSALWFTTGIIIGKIIVDEIFRKR